jgi:penicillin-binding protein 1A
MTNIKKAVLIVIAIYGFFAGFGGAMIKSISGALPDVETLEDYAPQGVSKIYDRKGKLIHEFYQERRIAVTLEKIPEPLIAATIGIEDKNFFRHCGIDLIGVTRAVIYNVLNRKAVQGASTITQQLARNLFLTLSKRYLRKIKEAVLAFRIERSFSKEEILELYFNQIYYGNGAYGVEAAAQRYYGRHVEDLTIVQCATLAGIPKSPENYNPHSSPERSMARRNFVLSRMTEQGMILPEEKAKLQEIPVELSRKPSFRGDYFIEEVRKWVTARYGPDLLYRGGLSVYTTLDAELQSIAEEAVQNGLEKAEERFRIDKEDTLHPLQMALLAMDTKTGAILAEIGGRDFRKSMFNRAVQAKRQPGSAFKPFTWMAALADTFTAASIVEDEPISIKMITGETYSPCNYDQKFLGPVMLREGLADSRNLVAVRLIVDVGPHQVVGYARRMGITSPLDPVIALSLGSSSVTILDMVSAYSTLANEGIRTKSFMIDRVTDKEGVLLYQHQGFSQRVISPQLAYVTVNLMQSVLNKGTAVGARSRGFYYPAAGKTGTTDECMDAWFVGFTPSLACAVWSGFDRRKRIGRNATGAMVSLPVWTNFMLGATESMNSPFEDFKKPDGIVRREICKVCGKLASDWVKEDVIEEVFIEGTEPTEHCNGIHPKKIL